MRRRRFLAVAVAASPALAGCFGEGEGPSDDGNVDDIPVSQDGYAPEDVEEPESTDYDADSFERIDVDGQPVPLAPVDVTYNWYARREARFVDARGAGQYDRARVSGSAWSPAPEGRDGSDPSDDWSGSDRVVCYCGCPHHLSSLRAAALVDAGFEDVYVVDEGFHEWTDRGYPVSGTDVDGDVEERVIVGRTRPDYEGAAVYATHVPTDQREAAFVDADGGFELALHFAGVSDDSEIRIEAPDYTVVGRLSELSDGVVTRP